MALQLLGFDDAVKVVEGMPPDCVAPGHHPAYIRNDARNYKGVEEVYQLYENEGKRWFHGFLSGSVPDSDFRDAFTVYGYGGPIADTDDGAFLAHANEAACAWARRERVLAEFIRFHPLLENWRNYGGRSLANRNTVCVDLTPDDLLASYRKRTRRDIRKGQRLGVAVSFPRGADMLEEFTAMYHDTMTRNAAADFYLFEADYLLGLLTLPDSFTAVACYDNAIVAIAILLVRGTTMEYHLSAMNETGMRVEANKVLLHEAMLRARKAGARRAHLGGGTTSASDDALLRFKSGFSSELQQFRIGDTVHFPKEFEDMRRRNDNPEGRVLFWR